MDSNDIAGLIIVGVLGLSIVVMSVVLLMGKGAFLIAGYNTMPKSGKEKYDRVVLSKFMGKTLLPIGILTPSIAIGGIYSISWLPIVYIAVVLGLVIFAVAYCNTGNRFKK